MKSSKQVRKSTRKRGSVDKLREKLRHRGCFEIEADQSRLELMNKAQRDGRYSKEGRTLWSEYGAWGWELEGE